MRLGPADADREAEQARRLLDEIEQRERAINALQAEQVLAVAEFAERRARLDGCHLATWQPRELRVCATELADARRVGVHAAEAHLSAAVTVVADLPRVFDSLANGAVTLPAVRAVAEEVVFLHPGARPLADELIAAELDSVLPSQARELARRRCHEIDPDAALRAAREHRAQRYVGVRPSSMIGIAVLSAPLPVEQAVACWHALDDHARAVYAEGDPRTVSQIMADTLVERVTGQVRSTEVTAHVNLVMSDATLLGIDDAPAQIPGHGPIPAALARALAATDSTWIRRLLTDPIDGSVATIESRRRRFHGPLRALILARDQRCRGIGCQAPIRDVDHVDDYCLGGLTSAGNGAGLCQRCHHLQDIDRVKVTRGADPQSPEEHLARLLAHPWQREWSTHRAALLRWTTPIGRPMTSYAPAVLGLGTATLDQLRLRRLRGHQARCPVPSTFAEPIRPVRHHGSHRSVRPRPNPADRPSRTG